MNAQISLATDDCSIARCHAVMCELRPHFPDEDAFVKRVRRQRASGYELAFLESENEVRSVAGFRAIENLAWGLHLYVDDLVTRKIDHGGGFGSTLLDWLVQQARARGCAQFHLDSGVHRFDAHRFYLHKGMDITCHHFALSL